MGGPFPRGTYLRCPGPNLRLERCLTRGRRYRVAEPFVDADGDAHRTDEHWFFLGTKYSHYDDLLIVFVADNEWREWEIELLRGPSDQAEVGEHLSRYFTPIEGFRAEYFVTAKCYLCGAALELSSPNHCPACGVSWKPG